VAVRGPEQHLQRAVAGVRLVDDLERREWDALGERGAEPGRQVRHLAVRRGSARGPFPDLAGAVRGLGGERLGEALEVHADTVASAAAPPRTRPGAIRPRTRRAGTAAAVVTSATTIRAPSAPREIRPRS